MWAHTLAVCPLVDRGDIRKMSCATLPKGRTKGADLRDVILPKAQKLRYCTRCGARGLASWVQSKKREARSLSSCRLH